MREYFINLKPELVPIGVKGPVWLGLLVLLLWYTLDLIPLLAVGLLLLVSELFTVGWLVATGSFLISLCPPKYRVSKGRFWIAVGLHGLSVIGLIYFVVVLVFFDLEYLGAVGDLGYAAFIGGSVSFMVIWRSRMRALVSLERRGESENRHFRLKWWQWRFFPFGVKLADIQRRLQEVGDNRAGRC